MKNYNLAPSLSEKMNALLRRTSTMKDTEFVTSISRNERLCDQQIDTAFGAKTTFDDFLHLYQGRRPVQKIQTRVYDLTVPNRKLQLAQRKRWDGVFVYPFRRRVLPTIHEDPVSS
jgi:hypothetical protein